MGSLVAHTRPQESIHLLSLILLCQRHACGLGSTELEPMWVAGKSSGSHSRSKPWRTLGLLSGWGYGVQTSRSSVVRQAASHGSSESPKAPGYWDRQAGKVGDRLERWPGATPKDFRSNCGSQGYSYFMVCINSLGSYSKVSKMDPLNRHWFLTIQAAVSLLHPHVVGCLRKKRRFSGLFS